MIDEMLAEIRKQKEKDAELAAIIIDNRQSIPNVYTFFNKNRDRIAVVQDFDNGLRILRFDKRGPSGHTNVNDVSKIGYELRMDGFIVEISQEAGQTLDEWTQTPEWQLGLLQVEYLAIWNTLSAFGEYEMARQMDKSENIQVAIQIGKEHCQEHNYKIW